MSDERRDRYAAALYALSAWHDRVPWGELEEYERAEWYPQADAAMDVADAEAATYRSTADNLFAQNMRLRAELDSAKAQIEARRVELLRVNESHAATIEGMRAELARVGDLQASEAEIVAAPLRASIERVRAWAAATEHGAAAAAVLAALEGSGSGICRECAVRHSQEGES